MLIINDLLGLELIERLDGNYLFRITEKGRLAAKKGYGKAIKQARSHAFSKITPVQIIGIIISLTGLILSILKAFSLL